MNSLYFVILIAMSSVLLYKVCRFEKSAKDSGIIVFIVVIGYAIFLSILLLLE